VKKKRYVDKRVRKRPRLLFTMDPSRGFIEGRPTNQISEGGNFIVRRKFRGIDATRKIKDLRGKATLGGDINIRSGPKYNFVRLTADLVTGMPARSELAPRRMTTFDRAVTVDFTFRINAPQRDRLTGYVLQFWQPVINPIAGVRVKNGRLEVVSRSGGSVASTKLTGDWYSLSVAVRPSNLLGGMKVSGDLNGRIRARINGGSQAWRATSDIFRPKFGWYGSLGQPVTVDIRHLEIRESL